MLFKISLLLASTLIYLNGIAQENSLLWKISGKNLHQESYIVGTLHAMCPDDFVMSNKINQVVKNADQIIFEVDIFNDENRNILEKAASTPVPDFFKDFDPNKIRFMDSVLTANNFSIEMFDMISPFGISSLLALKSLNCPNSLETKSMETEIYALAKGKEISSLETADFQVNLLNSISTPTYFYDYLSTYDTADQKTNAIIMAYKAEDLKTLNKLIIDAESLTDEQLDKMLTSRNLNWAQIIPEKINNKKSIIAVGAAHLLGDKGILKLLENQGYTLTPIFE